MVDWTVNGNDSMVHNLTCNIVSQRCLHIILVCPHSLLYGLNIIILGDNEYTGPN